VLAAVPAAAEGYGLVDCRNEPANPRCVIQVGTPAAPGNGGASGTSACRDGIGGVVPCYVEGAGWYGGDGCYYHPAAGAALAAAQAVGGVPAPPGVWYEGVCGYPPTTAVTRFRIFGAPPGPQLLADEAVKALRLPTPAIRVNPAPPAPQIVFLPTWVWVGAGSWGRRAATASVPGMSVTATADPVRLVLSPGDGAAETCTGPGTAWTTGADPATASGTCGHTYTAVPSGGVWTLRATVTWNVSWTGGGVAGTAPAMTTTAAVDLPVREAGALNTGGVG
jgi:hypothetical protein